MSRTLYTVGHSTHEMETFLDLLAQHEVTVVADVRSFPYSRVAHFNQETLRVCLKNRGVRYVFLGRELGARREETDCYIDGQVVYERAARSPLFLEGISRVRRGVENHTIALMCAEKEPLDCHRTILICRYLKDHVPIMHIRADGSLEPHSETEKRLKTLMDVAPSLFEPEDILLEDAYERRGKQIAYRSDSEGDTL